MMESVTVFFFQAEDGIRDLTVTGVQTCALPIFAGIGDPRVRILDRVWDFGRGGSTLSFETNQAMAACAGTWGVYIQADEVLHESGAALIRERLRQCEGEDRVEGLLVDYLHFYGDFDTVATDRHWYRRGGGGVRLRPGGPPAPGAAGGPLGTGAPPRPGPGTRRPPSPST